MNLLFINSIALALVTAANAANKIPEGVLGFALGVNHPDGSCKTTADFESDFALMKPYSSIARIFSASNCDSLKQILPALKSSGVKLIVGVWPTVNGGDIAEMNYLRQNLGDAEGIVGISVSSEALYSKLYSVDQLVKFVDEFKNLVHNELNHPEIPIGIADTWNKYQDGTANPVLPLLDFVLINAFPYWQGIHIDNAWDTFSSDIESARGVIKSQNPNVQVIVGETGWPTDGVNYDASVPNTENAEKFYKNSICSMVQKGTTVFVFELLDEPNKACAVGDNNQCSNVEQYWGVFNVDRTPKYSLDCPNHEDAKSSSSSISSESSASSSLKSIDAASAIDENSASITEILPSSSPDNKPTANHTQPFPTNNHTVPSPSSRTIIVPTDTDSKSGVAKTCFSNGNLVYVMLSSFIFILCSM